MKNYKQIQVTVDNLTSITCDCCKKQYDNILEIQEFLHYENDAGYGSVMGDGNRLQLDLCQHCTKQLLGSFIRVDGNYITGQSNNVSLDEAEKAFVQELEQWSSFENSYE